MRLSNCSFRDCSSTTWNLNHSKFSVEISIPVYSESTWIISANSQLAKHLKKHNSLLVTISPWRHRHNLEALDRNLRNPRRSIVPFEGILVLLIGDFWYILTVVRAASRPQIVSACFKRLQNFSLFTSLHLHSYGRLLALQNDHHATPDALHFSSNLLCLVEGKLQQNEKDNAILPTSVKLFREQYPTMQHVFSNINGNYRDVAWLVERAFITTKNIYLKYLNHIIASKIPYSER